jgi:hypothetical protein
VVLLGQNSSEGVGNEPTREQPAESSMLVSAEEGRLEPLLTTRRLALACLVSGLLVEWAADVIKAGPADRAHLPAVLAALGEGLIVAAALAALVDTRLKRDLANATSRMTATVFFRKLLGGEELPDEYFLGMERLAITDRLSLGAHWQVQLSWSPDREWVRVVSTVHNSVRNTSSGAWAPVRPWLVEHRDERPESKFGRYEVLVHVNSGKNRADTVKRRLYSKSELRRLTTRTPTGIALDINPDDLTSVPPGAVADITISGESYHAKAGLMPLVCTYPTLHQVLEVTGSAVEDLDLSVSSGTGTLRTGETVRRQDGSIIYKYWPTEPLAVRGSVMRVQWQPKHREDADGEEPDVEDLGEERALSGSAVGDVAGDGD